MLWNMPLNMKMASKQYCKLSRIYSRGGALITIYCISFLTLMLIELKIEA